MAAPFFITAVLISVALYFGFGVAVEPQIIQLLVIAGVVAFIFYLIYGDFQKHPGPRCRKN
jgi:hypothetical protein